jgi:hypothetical protein
MATMRAIDLERFMTKSPPRSYLAKASIHDLSAIPLTALQSLNGKRLTLSLMALSNFISDPSAATCRSVTLSR